VCPISKSHDRDGVENFRSDELGTPPPKTAKTGPKKDAKGRFAKGGPGGPGRRAKLKKLAGRLGALDPDTCEPWLRRFIVEARQHAADVLGDLPFKTAELSAVATELAEARAMRAGLMFLGSQGDVEARAEARHWLREVRQHQLALRGLINQEAEARRLGTEEGTARPLVIDVTSMSDEQLLDAAAASVRLVSGNRMTTPAMRSMAGKPWPPPIEELRRLRDGEPPPVEVVETPAAQAMEQPIPPITMPAPKGRPS
jgi:hypothetical protein